MPVVVWSRRFTTDAEARRHAIEELGIEVVATPAEGRRARRHRQHPSGADEGDARLRRCRTPADMRGRARCSSTPRGARSWTTPRWPRRSRRRALRVGLDVYANEPAGAEGSIRRSDPRAARCHRHASHRRVHRSGAGSHRRRNRPHCPDIHRNRQGAERRQSRQEDPGDANARSSAIATSPACSRMCSSVSAMPI